MSPKTAAHFNQDRPPTPLDTKVAPNKKNCDSKKSEAQREQVTGTGCGG